ncbi:MAG TPA: hypothetical protein ENK27_04570, partial [Desulfobulbus sp.]|nr:hypothetical protein [Desulfobulbus sp.]
LAAWLLGRFFLDRNPGKKFFPLFLQVFFVILVAGSCIELLQMGVDGRYPDLRDVMRNQLGCLVAFAFFSPVRVPVAGARFRLFQGGVLVLLLLTAWPLARAVIDERLAQSQFPVLSDFETPFERFRWKDTRQLRVVTTPVRHGEHALRVQLSTATYSGTSLFYFPHDWRGYRWLRFSVFNPGSREIALHCRINDAWHREHGQRFEDRYHHRFLLQAGWNDLAVPLADVRQAPAGRTMDMQRIVGFGIFVVRQPRPLVLYIDNVYLDR